MQSAIEGFAVSWKANAFESNSLTGKFVKGIS